MPRLQAIQESFAAGELSPVIQGRTSSPTYQQSCQIVENFYVEPRGGLERREGTEFIAVTKNPSGESRLIPFIFSREDSYMMEVGNFYFRFYRAGKQVLDPGAIEFYLGDGTSQVFWFGEAPTLDADIEVYQVDMDTPISDTLYTVSAANNPATNLISDYTGWTNPAPPDTITYSVMTVNSGIEMVSPAGRLLGDSAGIQDTFSVGLGSPILLESAITAVTYDLTNQLTSSPGSIGLPFLSTVVIQTATLPDNGGNPLTIDASFDLVDTSAQLRTFDCSWELKHGSIVLDSGSEVAVDLIGVTVTSTGNPITVYNPGDEITIEVSVTNESHDQSQATADSRSIDVTEVIVNKDAQWHFDLVDADGNTIIDASDTPTVEARSIEADAVTSPEPWTIRLSVDYGVAVTFGETKITNPDAGKYITFNTAPPAGDLINFRDANAPITQTVGAAAVGDAFEVPHIYPEADIHDLHFVQANDVMYFVHDKYHPRTLSRHGLYDWRFEKPDYDTGTGTKPPWAEAAYDPLNGYPRTVQFFQQRLIYGGTVSEPQTLWGSRVADFVNFTIPASPVPDDPVSLTIAAHTQELIEWLASSRVLQIGTTGNEHRVTVNSFLAVDNLPDVTRQSSYGSRHIQPQFIGTSTIFIQGSGRQVRNYDLERNANVEIYNSQDMAWMAEHITASGVIEIAYWQIPHSILWCVRADGVLLSMTYDPTMADADDFRSLGWARQITDGKFKSVGVIPVEGEDETWFIVERTIDGFNRRYVERMYNHGDPPQFVDGSTVYDGVLTNTMTGLDHLEGKTVQVVADNAVHPDRVVSGGSITLDDNYSHVVAGLAYVSKFKTAKFEGGNPSGSAQSAMIGWSEIYARVVESALPTINGVQAAERDPSTPMNVAQPLFTGDVRTQQLGYDLEGAIEVEATVPKPCHVLSLFGTAGLNAG